MAGNNIKDSEQALGKPKPFRLTHLGSLNQLLKAGSKVLRAMASGELDSQLGARLMNGLHIMRAIVETSTIQRIEQKLDELQGAAAEGNLQIGYQADARPAQLPH